MDKVGKGYALADIESTDALLSVYLVSRQREHINALLVDVYLNMTNSLNGVGVEKDLLFLAYCSYLINRLDSTYLVVCVHYGDQSCILADSLSHVLGVDETLVAYGDVCHLKALLFKVFAGMKNCMMLKHRGNDVLLASFCHHLGSSLYSPVVRFRAAAGKEYLSWLSAESLCHLFTGYLNIALCVASKLIYTGSISVGCTEIGQHGVEDFL